MVPLEIPNHKAINKILSIIIPYYILKDHPLVPGNGDLVKEAVFHHEEQYNAKCNFQSIRIVSQEGTNCTLKL